MRARWLPFAVMSLVGCAAQPAAPPRTTLQPAAGAQISDAEIPDVEQDLRIADAKLAIRSGMQQAAIDRALDPVIATFEQRWGRSARRVYSARSPAESAYYLNVAQTHHQDAITLGPVWVQAYELKAYALLDLGRFDEARAALDKALALAPENAGVLEELGAHYEAEKNWPAAMETFRHAESAARAFAPERYRDDELARAWRGQAFVDVEVGMFDEAEQLYRRCLELDKNDRRAAAELAYIRRKRQSADPANATRVYP